MPGVPADAYKAKASALHVVAKGRQDAGAANSVQVRCAAAVRRRGSLSCRLHLQRHERAGASHHLPRSSTVQHKHPYGTGSTGADKTIFSFWYK